MRKVVYAYTPEFYNEEFDTYDKSNITYLGDKAFDESFMSKLSNEAIKSIKSEAVPLNQIDGRDGICLRGVVKIVATKLGNS